MRLYVPFGTQWYGYFMRRLAERPANLTFFMRALAERRSGPARPTSTSNSNCGGPSIVGDPRASVIDAAMTRVVDDTLVKIMAWYDNGWGFTHQMVRTALAVLGIDRAL